MNHNDDTIKSAANAPGYNTEATDGNFAQGTSAAPGSAWAKLWWRTNEMRTTPGVTEVQRRTIYFELMGLDSNGVPYNDPLNHPVVLNPGQPDRLHARDMGVRQLRCPAFHLPERCL